MTSLFLTDGHHTLKLDRGDARELELKLNVSAYGHSWRSLGTVLFHFHSQSSETSDASVASVAVSDYTITTEQLDFLKVLQTKRGWESCKDLKIDSSDEVSHCPTTMSHSILYIGASWCGPCKRAKPLTEELAKAFHIPIAVKDLDDDLTEEERAPIKKVPTIRVLDGEKKVVMECNQYAVLEEWVKSNVKVSTTGEF